MRMSDWEGRYSGLLGMPVAIPILIRSNEVPRMKLMCFSLRPIIAWQTTPKKIMTTAMESRFRRWFL